MNITQLNFSDEELSTLVNSYIKVLILAISIDWKINKKEVKVLLSLLTKVNIDSDNTDSVTQLLRVSAVQPGGSSAERILIVDGDGNENYGPGEYPWCDCEPAWEAALDIVFEREIEAQSLSNGKNYIYEEVSENAATTAKMNNYDLVIWETGYDWGASSLSASERSRIKGYLNNGGNIWVIGENIMYGVDPQAGLVKIDLFKNYMHLYKVSQGVGIPMPLIGVIGDEAIRIMNKQEQHSNLNMMHPLDFLQTRMNLVLKEYFIQKKHPRTPMLQWDIMTQT